MEMIGQFDDSANLFQGGWHLARSGQALSVSR